MNMYKLEDNDVIKILPILMRDGSFKPFLEVNSLFVDNKLINETNGEYLSRLRKYYYFDDNLRDRVKRNILNKRIFFYIYKDGKIDYIYVGKQLFDIITHNYKFDPRNNLQLKVKIKLVDKVYKNYDDSYIIEEEWEKPAIDINSQNAWKEWYISQGIYLEDIINVDDYKNHMNILKENFPEYVNYMTSKIRDERLEMILNKNSI